MATATHANKCATIVSTRKGLAMEAHEVKIVFPTRESKERFLTFLENSDWSTIIDEDFYFEYIEKIHRDLGLVTFSVNDNDPE
jgi:hypothetical protein